MGGFNIRQDYLVNHKIKAPKLRVILNDGTNVGVLSTQEALRKAQEVDLDLVVVSAGANPPVAKILDFNKFLYDERKKSSAIRAKSKKSELKELVFGPTIGTGDLASRIERTREWLKEGNRVKIVVKFKGREIIHPEVGFEKIKFFTQELGNNAKVDQAPRLNGNLLIVTYVLNK